MARPSRRLALPLALLLAAGAIALLAVPGVSAWGFGSRVALGDADFVPTWTPVGPPPLLCRVPLGDSSSALDDGYVLAFGPSHAAPQSDDVRVSGPAAGSLVADDAASLALKAVPFAACVGLAIVGADVDGDGVYNAGDASWLDTQGLWPGGSTGLSALDVRLTGTRGGDAGTVVRPGDWDLQAFAGAGAFGPATLKFWDQDLDGTWSAGDALALTSSVGPLLVPGDARVVPPAHAAPEEPKGAPPDQAGPGPAAMAELSIPVAGTGGQGEAAVPMPAPAQGIVLTALLVGCAVLVAALRQR